MKIKYPYLATATVAVAFLFVSCGNESENTENTTSIPPKETAAKKDSAENVKLLSMPAPMQIASAIRKSGSKYSEELLLPMPKNAASDHMKKISLGMYAVDLGYANVYEQKQTSIKYFTGACKLADELNVLGTIRPDLAKQFRENFSNKDSITYYTLSTFQGINSNLMNSNRSSDAYLILAGSYLEGVYLCSKLYAPGKDKSLVNVIGEQKIFLTNLLELLNNYKEDADFQVLIAELSKLDRIYGKVTINYKPTNETDSMVDTIIISDELINEIASTAAEIRSNVVKWE